MFSKGYVPEFIYDGWRMNEGLNFSLLKRGNPSCSAVTWTNLVDSVGHEYVTNEVS